ncbi:hypothetical protein KR093_011583 [Drosophila rubida]|uniref:DUF4806 domain-containing protein n=1 Tax=Drosophila rubida TaxID=30044 RepID=A0AAD4K2F7_9MUSC|nr:hypothetical protein KR093_011583 [Drosophila rubida]
MKPLGFEKHICRIFDEALVTEMNFDGVSSKLGLTTYANLNSALYESLKKDGYTYADYRSTVRAAFHKTKNRIYKSISKKRREGKSMPTTAKIFIDQRDESPTADEDEEDRYQTRIYKTTSKKRSVEISMPTSAKRVMVHTVDSPLDNENVDRFQDSSPMDFIKDDPDYVMDDEPDELDEELSTELEQLALDFPIKDKSELEAVEKKILISRSKYVELFKFYLKSGSFEQTIGSFFDENLSCDMSYDGYGSKKAFSNYVHFNIALFESQKSDQFSYEDYKKGVRNAFLKCNKRPKKRADKKK